MERSGAACLPMYLTRDSFYPHTKPGDRRTFSEKGLFQNIF
jgi:hypothetical protein